MRINELVKLAGMADTCADRSVLPKSVASALQLLDADIAVISLSTPVTVSMADGNSHLCTEEISVDLELVTAAGPVRLRDVSCLITDSMAEEFILGNDTIKSFGSMLTPYWSNWKPSKNVVFIQNDSIAFTSHYRVRASQIASQIAETANSSPKFANLSQRVNRSAREQF